MSANVEWTGVVTLTRNIREYPNKVVFAVHQVALYWSAVMEAYAKQNASWTDRTGNARQSLYTLVERDAQDIVTLYLSHGVHYGVFLEVRWSGRYAIIWPTIEAHLRQIWQMLEGIFR